MHIMGNVPGLFTEEDIRSKIVVPWLMAQGFDIDQVLLEFSFSVRLGRTVVTVKDGRTERVNENRHRITPKNKRSIVREQTY